MLFNLMGKVSQTFYFMLGSILQFKDVGVLLSFKEKNSRAQLEIEGYFSSCENIITSDD